MSDLEKVYSYAVSLSIKAKLEGKDTPIPPIQLRWEGSGDSVHAAKLLSGLKHKTYPNSTTRIKYHADINIYEAADSLIYKKAEELLAFVHGWGTDKNQTYKLFANADVTRNSGKMGQDKAHIMFVRNIMPTNDSGESLTDAGDVPQTIHTNGLRNRANSLNGGGHLRMGMSGAPGLASASADARMEMMVKDLFVNAKGLVDTAKESGLTVQGGSDRLGKADFDEGGVMKNNGVALGIKKTYYLTFVK